MHSLRIIHSSVVTAFLMTTMIGKRVLLSLGKRKEFTWSQVGWVGKLLQHVNVHQREPFSKWGNYQESHDGGTVENVSRILPVVLGEDSQRMILKGKLLVWIWHALYIHVFSCNFCMSATMLHLRGKFSSYSWPYTQHGNYLFPTIKSEIL